MKKQILQIIEQSKKFIKLGWKSVKKLFSSWPKAFIGTFFLLIASYYPLGGMISESIDKTEDYDMSSLDAGQSQSLEMIAHLINREVNQNIWTPNLPFFFPAYCLDNMPAYQSGMVKGLYDITKALSAQIQCAEDEKNQKLMADAAKLLNYPVNVWLFAPDNKLKTAPSSSSQYRKARKKLKDINVALKEEKCFWVRDEKNLRDLGNTVVRGLMKTSLKLENEIREGSESWFDTKADDVFYFYQGRIYAYLLVLKKAGRDYKQVLMSKNLYPEWTAMLRALQQGTEVSPLLVVNGKIDANVKPNHLVALGYHILRAENLLMRINLYLNGENQNAN